MLNSPSFNAPRTQRIAAVLAFAGLLPFVLTNIPMLPVLTAGHKIYLRQWRWAAIYAGIALVPIPWIAKMAWLASVIEGIWYLMQEPEVFDLNFNRQPGEELVLETVGGTVATATVLPTVVQPGVRKVMDVTQAVRELDQLRQDGLISEYEFEQKRRKLIDRIG
jgi:hypothetical protein